MRILSKHLTKIQLGHSALRFVYVHSLRSLLCNTTFPGAVPVYFE